MKNKIAIASAFFAASSFSFAEIALTEGLSVEGFVDTSYTDSSGGADSDDASFDLDEVEISFLFESGAVSAQVDLQVTGGADANNALDNSDIIDQAFISYDVAGGTVSAGFIDSQLGFEAFEAPGLYTNTLAYNASQLPGTDEGVKFTKQLDEVSSLGVALLDNGSYIGDESGSDTVVEIAYGRDLGNGLGAFVGYRSDDAGNNDLINAYVTYETGALLLAAEIVDGENDTDLQFLANYAYADNASVTVRYTNEENVSNIGTDAAGLTVGDDRDIITLAHNLALADNLRLTTELKDNGADDDEYEFGVSLLFTF